MQNKSEKRRWEPEDAVFTGVVAIVMAVWVLTPECYWLEIRALWARILVASMVVWFLYRTLKG